MGPWGVTGLENDVVRGGRSSPDRGNSEYDLACFSDGTGSGCSGSGHDVGPDMLGLLGELGELGSDAGEGRSAL